MLFNQTFDFADVPRVLFLLFLELLLSADNAIILGLLSSHLPPEKRKKALFGGLLSAIIFRGVGLFFVSSILKIVWIQLLGAFYLFYISLDGIRKPAHSLERKPRGFWKTLLLIELFDFAFAIDSILAAVAFINTLPLRGGAPQPKLWIVYVGATIGLITIRFAAKLFSRLVLTFPNLKKSAYLMVGWIGVKLALNACSHIGLLPGSVEHYFESLYWIFLVGLLLFGFKKHDRPSI